MSDFEIENGVLIRCNVTGEVTVPQGVKVIEANAFMVKAKVIVFPEGVEEINMYAIRTFYCVTIHLPKSLKLIKKNAFAFFHEKAKIIYAGTAEDFKKIKIETTGNRAFIRRMEEQLGLETRFVKKPTTAKEKKTTVTKITKQQICEYADNLAKQFNIERVEKENLGLDMWHNVIIETEGLFSVQDNLINIAISNEFLKIKDWREQLTFKNHPLTIESAKRLGKMQLKKAMDTYCKGVVLIYQGNAEKDAKKILSQDTEPKWGRIYATSYREVPIKMMDPSGELSTNNPPQFEDGKYVIEVDRSDNGISHYMLSEEQLPKNGCIIVPLRLRIVSDSVPTQENVKVKNWELYKGGDELIPLTKEYFCESSEHNYKNYYYFDFYIDGIQHQFCIMLMGYGGSSNILEYKIGKDEAGYYMDALFKMRVSRFVY